MRIFVIHQVTNAELNNYADIILPLPLPRLFTYSVPENMSAQIVPGSRVVVSFGKKKYYSGIVYQTHNSKPPEYEVKPITSVLDPAPVVTLQQLQFWDWIAEYYVCSIGEVYKAALPSGLKLESESRVIYNALFETDEALSPREYAIIDFISAKKICSVQDMAQELTEFNILPVLKQLLDKNAIFLNEEIKETYKPRQEKFFSLSAQCKDETVLAKWFDKLERAPRQQECLMSFLSQVGGLGKAIMGANISRTELFKNPVIQPAPWLELVNKGIIEQSTHEVSRVQNSQQEAVDVNSLSPIQEEALQSIHRSFDRFDTTLLHGVTSSGKTEIYIHLINHFLRQEKQVLYLLPEIALTTQITSRLRKHFGNRLGIYHSKFSDSERVEVWNNLLHQKGFEVIIGVRSSIFLPFKSLGLIIVDEEHESSFKQFDPAPRYHARDAALVLARQHGAKVLLGTATPSMESYFNVRSNRYGLVELHTRHEGMLLPRILAVDTKEARRKKQMKSIFSPQLITAMRESIEKGEQVILFQNRRGFAPFVECAQCAWIPKCKHCDVSMTYHKNQNMLVCHYCSYSYPLPDTCSACGSPTLETKGFGTEKIEEEVRLILPEARVARMDLDTAKSKKAFEKIIGDFESHQLDILIGTQMVSKGLDFDNVNVVGILNADNMLNYPDFRAFERSFQLMAQVSGRAGRKNKQGLVILQTSDPNHPVILDVIANNFINHYQQQLNERQMFKYPPFYRLINLSVKHKDAVVNRKAAIMLGNQLRSIFGDRILGPQEPPINRIANFFIQRIILKIEKKGSPAKVKSLLMEVIHSIVARPEYRQVIIQVDVDPY